MKLRWHTILWMTLLLAPLPALAQIKVVATTTTYGWVAKTIGGDHVTVFSIAEGDEDVHFVRPKPSFAEKLAQADLLITTGMDLELWLPGLMDKASNPRIREGQIGYVSASDGIKKLEVPATADRSQGGVHIYGNPHIQVSPINIKQVAYNIAIGLSKVDPDHRSEYESRLKTFQDTIDRRLFGDTLVDLVGGPTLCRLAESGRLISFLEGRKIKGTPGIDLLGGWMKQALPLRDRELVTYHRNWVYFTSLFGIQVVGEVEPKPAIPPSPKDVEKLINLMKRLHVPVILAANYFDETKIHRVADAVGATTVIVPLDVGGAPGTEDYFKLVDTWIGGLLDAYGASS